jgi:hypothetical protein
MPMNIQYSRVKNPRVRVRYKYCRRALNVIPSNLPLMTGAKLFWEVHNIGKASNHLLLKECNNLLSPLTTSADISNWHRRIACGTYEFFLQPTKRQYSSKSTIWEQRHSTGSQSKIGYLIIEWNLARTANVTTPLLWWIGAVDLQLVVNQQFKLVAHPHLCTQVSLFGAQNKPSDTALLTGHIWGLCFSLHMTPRHFATGSRPLEDTSSHYSHKF